MLFSLCLTLLALYAEVHSEVFSVTDKRYKHPSDLLVLFQGKDDVYLCIKDEDSVNIHAAYVLGRTHPELAQEVHCVPMYH